VVAAFGTLGLAVIEGGTTGPGFTVVVEAAGW
jgi:hypothetical protein